MTVTFCGHSTIYGEDLDIVKQRLYEEIKQAILCGAEEFLFGGYGEFDLLCARAVKEIKKKYPNIKSVLVVPYIDEGYNKELYDCSEYPPIENVPKRFAIIKRNEYMVEISDVVIAYVKYSTGGAYRTYSSAVRKGKNVINLFSE